MRERAPNERGPAPDREPAPRRTSSNAIASTTITREITAWLAEDAATLLVEAAQFLEAGEQALAAALLADKYDELVVASAHALICSARARRFLSIAVHVDLERVA